MRKFLKPLKLSTPIAAILLTVACSGSAAAAPHRLRTAHAIIKSGDTIADLALGQRDFTHRFVNFVDGEGMWAPSAVTVDNAGHVYVADAKNDRVLGWNDVKKLTDGAPADLLIGQSGLYDSGGGIACSKVTPTAGNFCDPGGLATDSQGNLYVIDSGNNRVLVFANPFAQCAGTPCIIGNAEAVFGQPDFASNQRNQGGGPTAQSLYSPVGAAVDGSDDLFIADEQNNRVLEYRQPLTSSNHCDNTFPCADVSADVVYGQSDLVSNNNTSSLYRPAGVWVDADSNVYVADLGNARVVEYNTPTGNDPTPSTIFEFPDSHGGNMGLLPNAVAVDPSGDLYVSDEYQRIDEFNQPLTSPSHCNNTFPCTVESADAMFGQSSTDSLGCNQYSSSPNARTLCDPMGLGIDSYGDLYVADSSNNRVLAYDAPLTSAAGCNGSFPCYDVAADLVLGQVAFIHEAANLVDRVGLYFPEGVAVDSANHVYVADTSNSRILGWSNVASMENGAPADLVIGQPDFYSSTMALAPPVFGVRCSEPTSASTLCAPSSIAVDAAGNLYVADTYDARVLEYDTPFAGCNSFPCVGPPAHMIVGQDTVGGHTCTPGGASSATLCYPMGVAVDGSGDLFVSDYAEYHILEYNDPLAACGGSGQCFAGAADVVFGRGVNANRLFEPEGIAIDSAGDLFVADSGDSRVLEYYRPLATPDANGAGDTTADRVWGQNGSFTTSGGCFGSPTASSLCLPGDVAVDAVGDLFVSDTGDHRVLEYPHRGKTTRLRAAVVFGQKRFSTEACNLGHSTASAKSLCFPGGISLDSAGDLWVADSNNNRVLKYLNPLKKHVRKRK